MEHFELEGLTEGVEDVVEIVERFNVFEKTCLNELMNVVDLKRMN